MSGIYILPLQKDKELIICLFLGSWVFVGFFFPLFFFFLWKPDVFHWTFKAFSFSPQFWGPDCKGHQVSFNKFTCWEYRPSLKIGKLNILLGTQKTGARLQKHELAIGNTPYSNQICTQSHSASPLQLMIKVQIQDHLTEGRPWGAHKKSPNKQNKQTIPKQSNTRNNSPEIMSFLKKTLGGLSRKNINLANIYPISYLGG